MIAEILIKTDNEQLQIAKQYKAYYLSNIENFKLEFEDYLSKNDIKSAALDFIKIYQLIGYEQDEISTFIQKKIKAIYFANIDIFIEEKEEFLIYSFIDIFYCNPSFLEKNKDLITFFEVTYPILLLKTEDMSSFIAIASMRYIAILGSEDEGKIFLKKYLLENKDGMYVEDVKEEL